MLVVNYVQPIKDKNQINELREALKLGTQAKRNVFLLELGIRCPARISDLLQLRVADVRGVARIKIKESKTGKVNEYIVNNQLAPIITEYTNGMADEDYLFPSRKGDKPITRTQAYRVLNKASDWAGLDLELGCHSLRKTFSYHYYRLNPSENLAYLQQILKHSSTAVTLRYIGIEQEEIADSLQELTF